MPEMVERNENCSGVNAPSRTAAFWTGQKFGRMFEDRRMFEEMWDSQHVNDLRYSLTEWVFAPLHRRTNREDARKMDDLMILCSGWPEEPELSCRALIQDPPARIEWLISEIEEAAHESTSKQNSIERTVPVDADTVRAAIKFANLLPASTPMPEVACDPDGEISFDWIGGPDNVFSVSIDGHGRLAYAGRFGDKRKINGVEQLSDTFPPEITLGIERVTSGRV